MPVYDGDAEANADGDVVTAAVVTGVDVVAVMVSDVNTAVDRVMVYVYAPSSDDTTVIVFAPTVSAIEPHDEPDVAHVTPPIVIVPDENVGVNATLTTRYATVDVYDDVNDENADESVSDDVVAGADVVPVAVMTVITGDDRVTVIVYAPSSDDVTVIVLTPIASVSETVDVPLVGTDTAVPELNEYVTVPPVNTIVACSDQAAYVSVDEPA